MPANDPTPPKGNESTDEQTAPVVTAEAFVQPTKPPIEIDTTNGLTEVSLHSDTLTLQLFFERHELVELIDELTEAVDAIDERDELGDREAAE